MLALLLRVGLVRRKQDGCIRWPLHSQPWWIWKVHVRCALRGERIGRVSPWFGVFRNLPHVIKWEPGRLLPRRWGFYVLGLEIGDRG